MTRVALVDHSGGPYASELAGALPALGIEAALLGPRPGARAADGLLARRGFTGGLAHVPLVTARLLRDDFDVAHAFTAPDAFAALLTRRPVVFTCTETLSRGTVANARLRLRMLERAAGEPDAVLAASDAVAESMLRWLAVEAPVLDAPAHARLYGELASRRG